jgi:hypothetical protein
MSETLTGVTAFIGKHEVFEALGRLTVNAREFRRDEWCKNDIEKLEIVADFLRREWSQRYELSESSSEADAKAKRA